MSSGIHASDSIWGAWISRVRQLRRAFRPPWVRGTPQRLPDAGPAEFPFRDSWIVFELSSQPFRTRTGEIHPIALMEASSRDLLGFWFVRGDRPYSDAKAMERPFEQAHRELRPWPTRLLVATDRTEHLVGEEAARLGIAVVHVDPERLHRFTADAEHIFQRGLAGYVPAERSRIRPSGRGWRVRRSAT